MEEKKYPDEISVKQVFNTLSKPLKTFVSVALGATGLSLFSIIGVIAKIINEVDSKGTINLNLSLFIILCASIFVAILGLIVLAGISLMSLFRLKINTRALNKTLEKIDETSAILFDSSCSISTSANQLNDINVIYKQISSLVANRFTELQKEKMAQYILTSDEISALEQNVCKNARIVVMTSKFQLDKGKLLKIILDNICKGAIYEYLVPNADTNMRDFKLVYTAWWKMFCDRISESECYEHAGYSDEFLELRKKAANHDNCVYDQALEYFKKHVVQKQISASNSLVTIIMYQQEPQPSTKWEIIMKLPTVSDDDTYYAFLVPEEEAAEKMILIRGVETLCFENDIPLDLERHKLY